MNEVWVLVYRRNVDEDVIKGVVDDEYLAIQWCRQDIKNDYEGPFRMGEMP